MKCREFDTHMADWVAGRLSVEQCARLEAHCAACPACARAADAERRLRARWQELPPVREGIDLWPRVAARLETPAPAPRFLFARRLVWGGALATAALVVLLVRPAPPPQPYTPAWNDGRVNERKVVQMVAELKQIPDPENDIVLSEMHDYRPNTRLLLTGSERK
jgi:anti-sigma factor RsiW